MSLLDAPTKPRRDGLFGGLSVVAQRGNGLGNNALSNGTSLTGLYRYGHRVTASSQDVRLVFGNYTGNGLTVVDGPNPITVSAYLEPPTAATAGSGSINSGSLYPVTFRGVATTVIAPGGFAVSDPIPARLIKNQFIYTRTLVAVTSGQKWPLSQYVGGGDINYQDAFLLDSLTGASGGAMTGASTFGAGYGPSAIIGTLAAGTADPKVYLFSGDSIAFGSGATEQDLGFLARAAYRDGLAFLNIGRPSELATGFQGVSRRQRMPLAAGCTHVVNEYGVNDLNSAVPLATLQAAQLDIWSDFASRRLRVFQSTITPVTTSSDGWITLANQTVLSMNTNRVLLNNWFRAGSPIHPTTKVAVAVGTPGALLAGTAGHPLAACPAAPFGCIEVADQVESARDSGKWRAPTVLVADAAITASSGTLTSATAGFNAGMVGSSVRVAGAGAAGAALNTVIVAYTNATTVSLNNAAGTTVSGASLAIDPPTADGTHPTSSLHKRAAAGVDLAAIA